MPAWTFRSSMITGKATYGKAGSQAASGGPVQVASFASTPMATEIILGDGLPIGETLTESETLLQQTEQAAETDLKCAVLPARPPA